MSIVATNLTVSRFQFEAQPSLILDGLQMFLDPDNTDSYPGSGTAVTNIAPATTSNNINGTLDDANMYQSPNNEPAYFRVRSDSTIERLDFSGTISRAGNGDSTLHLYFWSDYDATGQYGNSQALFGGKYTNYMALTGGSGATYGVEAETNGVGTPEGNHDYFARTSDGQVFNTGQWNDWVSVFDSGTASNYFNGNLATNTYSISSTSTHSFNRLGSTSTGTGSGARGGDIRMGILLYYNRALTAAEIAQNRSVFLGRFN